MKIKDLKVKYLNQGQKNNLRRYHHYRYKYNMAKSLLGDSSLTVSEIYNIQIKIWKLRDKVKLAKRVLIESIPGLE